MFQKLKSLFVKPVVEPNNSIVEADKNLQQSYQALSEAYEMLQNADEVTDGLMTSIGLLQREHRAQLQIYLGILGGILSTNSGKISLSKDQVALTEGMYVDIKETDNTFELSLLLQPETTGE